MKPRCPDRRAGAAWLGLLLFALTLPSLAAGCIGDVDAPTCSSAADCDRDAGYLFCRQGYCFKTPAPTVVDEGADGEDPGDADVASAATDLTGAAAP